MTRRLETQSSQSGPTREWCEKHREWYAPFTGPMDPNGVPCSGCRLEAEAHWREAEDQNIRALTGMEEECER